MHLKSAVALLFGGILCRGDSNSAAIVHIAPIPL
jgi:hypothetical protein